jgi:hypothetical protein
MADLKANIPVIKMLFFFLILKVIQSQNANNKKSDNAGYSY